MAFGRGGEYKQLVPLFLPVAAQRPSLFAMVMHPKPSAELTLSEFQRLIREMYLEKDLARGIDGTFMWFMEEVGELASALRNGTHEERLEEFADVLAWLATIANMVDVDLTEAVRQKYGSGCPGCGKLLCVCDDVEKP